MSLVLSGKDLIKTAEGHMRSTCRKVNSQARCPAQYNLSRRLTHDLHKSRVTCEVPLFY